MIASQNEYAIMVEPLDVADGGGWLATVPALPGCMGDGESREEALADVQNAIVEWQAAARELGRDVPRTGWVRPRLDAAKAPRRQKR
ncbi:type II toxin-antitoxin system HicB family antitoxin [Phenylobacterium sp.]|jgi:antitoxin HicB|uniref:type II toxin-antitoxin system HicB family antitoxin n=1 Tax=Phenylobacterium sp. TaxID=1871053 RepID=UPI0037C93B25